MVHKDLEGKEIRPDDWYYSICDGQVVPHHYVEGWKTDEARLATGKVIRNEMGMLEAKYIFSKHGIMNSWEGDTPKKKVEHHFNINVKCRVVLTEAGIKILQEQAGYKFTLPCWNPQDRTFTSELWDVMHIFGDSHYMGNNDLPFEHNEIVILEGTA